MSTAPWLTLVLTLFTLTAFAANSILCRLALASHFIGDLEFTVVRLLSGLLILSPLLLIDKPKPSSTNETARRPRSVNGSSVIASMALFFYALFFSLAYVRLEAGTGALILFAAVQITMIGVSIYQGNRLSALQWFGFVIAFGGLVYLISPGLSAPPVEGTVMMVLSGASWGIYSLLGKDKTNPMFATARNFLFCAPGCLVLAAYVVWFPGDGGHAISSRGILLATLSGAVTSGLGYVLWYLTLRRITTTVASIVQLAVPVLAGIGGIVFLHENLSMRLFFATSLIVGGIVMTVSGERAARLLSATDTG